MPDYHGCGQAVNIIAGRLTFVAVNNLNAFRENENVQASTTYCIDEELVYYPFYKDFGPLNLGLAFRFCRKTAQLLQEAEGQGKRLIFYTGPSAQYKANAAVLVGIFQVMLLQRSADRAYSVLQPMEPFLPFRDASMGASTFDLTVLHCIRGIARAKAVGFLDWDRPDCSFNLAEYEHYEQVENGDLNWIVPGKFLAFSGPSVAPFVMGSYVTHTPEDYHRYFHHAGVTAVVRLNNRVYDGQRFVKGGFRMHELFFHDGTCPSDAILQAFLAIAEAEPGALAVHCKAGLGRTGVLICAYLIKHYGFSAEEAIGYIRVCRPGSVIGAQQNYLVAKAGQLAAEGAAFACARRAALRQAASAACDALPLPTTPMPTAAPVRQSIRPATVPAKTGPAAISITATSVRGMAVASPVPSAAAKTGAPAALATPPGREQRPGRTSSTGTLKAMSLDGGGEDDGPGASLEDGGCSGERGAEAGNAASSTATSARINNFLRGRSASLRVATGRPAGPNMSRTRSQSAAAQLVAAAAQHLPAHAAHHPASKLSVAGAATGRRMPLQTQPTTPTTPSSQSKAQRGVARMLAPNGQPRKVPAALLASGNRAALHSFAADEEATPQQLRQGWTILSS